MTKLTLIERAERDIERILTSLEEITNKRVKVTIYNGDRTFKDSICDYESYKIMLDYYRVQNNLFAKGYRDNLHEMSICKLNVDYMRERINNQENGK